MPEPINPGVNPQPASRLAQPARLIGRNSGDIEALGRRIGSLERLLQPYHPRRLGAVNDQGAIATVDVLARGGGAENYRAGHAFHFWLGDRENSKLYLGPGTVSYVEVPRPGEEDKKPPAVEIQPIFPVFSGRPLNVLDRDDLPPAAGIGSRSGGSLWLVCQQVRCGSTVPSGGSSPERVVLANRGETPAASDGESLVLIARFDIVREGNTRRLDNVDLHLQSDWIQYYRCDEDSSSGSDDSDDEDDSSDDSSDSGGSNSSDDSKDPDSAKSASSDSSEEEEEEEPGECCPPISVSADVRYPSCFSTAPAFECDDGGAGLAVIVDVSATVSPLPCTDCHRFAHVGGSIAGVSLPYKGIGIGGSVTWEAVKICPVAPCSQLGGSIHVIAPVKAGASDPDSCVDLSCRKSFHVQLGPYCGSECNTTIIASGDDD